MSSTKQSKHAGATADRQITSVANCMPRASVAGASAMNGGTNMNTAGTKSATGTSTTTTRYLLRERAAEALFDAQFLSQRLPFSIHQRAGLSVHHDLIRPPTRKSLG